MNKAIFESILQKPPDTEEKSYIFIVGNQQLAENIFSSGFISVLIKSGKEGYISSAGELEEVLSSMESGFHAEDYIFVPCLSKKDNESLQDYLESASLQFRDDGWKLFTKGYLKRPGGDTQLKPILQEYVDSYKLPSEAKQEAELPPVMIKSFDEIEEKRAEWLVQDLIPKGQLTTMAGDGGVGKTSLWCAIASSVSSGKRCLLDVPFENRKEGKVLIFSGEDSAEYVLRRRLRKHGANLSNIYTVSISDENFDKIKFGSPVLESIIEQIRPVLVVFDPLQAFIDGKIKMGDRNALRQSLIPVAGLGEKYGTTFLIILHSNKQSGAWGRRRMADSADIWDFSRSVLMVGSTQQESVNYVSQEKSNYGRLSDTHLFSIEDEVITDKGTTSKHDRDFVLEELHEQKRQAPARDNARDAVLEFLSDGQPKYIKELDEYCSAMSITKSSLRRAKDELKAEGLIRYLSGGGRSGGGWRVQKVVN